MTGHPRLWFTSSDVPRLRALADPSNDVWMKGLKVRAERARADMLVNVPAQDGGTDNWEQYPSEMYAELFAFMSLAAPDAQERDRYGKDAAALLMTVVKEAAKGVDPGKPFRSKTFSTFNRSRWWGEAFPLAVDWAYPYLTASDKDAIRTVFLRWCDENVHANATSDDHPEPIGMVNDPRLLANQTSVRWSGNNYFTAHMRNIGLMAMALDDADDPGGSLHAYLTNATGAWLYMTDALLRGDCRGGLPPEGFEYSPQAIGYVAQLLLALHTAGRDDPSVLGRQVVLTGNPYWDGVVPGYLHSLSPVPVTPTDPNYAWLGSVYQPANYGEVQDYYAPDFIELFGPLGLYDQATGNSSRLDALRFAERNLAPGGEARLLERVAKAEEFEDALLTFALLDPSSMPSDPRPATPLGFYAEGLGRILARTGWGSDATWFTYKLGWNRIDHQNGDGNQLELYRKGEWLVKERSGYGSNIGSSDYHNTLAIENDKPPNQGPADIPFVNWQRGSQWAYDSDGDGKISAVSFGKDFVYAQGDSTALYNSAYLGSTDVVHASRSILWLEPDHVVVYDRARTKTDGRFKRFWLCLPRDATVSGQRVTMATGAGQELRVTSLLPKGATLSVGKVEDLPIEEANLDPVTHRLLIEAGGGPRATTFLTVLEGADAATAPASADLVTGTGGSDCEGAIVGDTVVVFRKELVVPFTGVTFTVAARTTRHILVGLDPLAGYSVTSKSVGGSIEFSVTPGGSALADSGGVLDF